MVRRVFFSYHFQEDAWRANQVRNSWVTEPVREAAGFFDAADQEEIKRDSNEAIKRWIDEQLRGTTVTAVLIGEETAKREFVQYEIEKSFKRGNALLGIRIHDLKNRQRKEGWEGSNPLKDYAFEIKSGEKRLSDVYPTYDWSHDNGRENIGEWVEDAVEAKREIPDSALETLERNKKGKIPVAAKLGAAATVWYYREEILDTVSRLFNK
jgi:hypothetical protein